MLRGLQKKKTILKLVEDDPGVGFIDIMKSTGYANGIVGHHLRTLEREGSIRIKREKRKIWIFHPTLDSNDDNIRIFLRKETCKKILVFLLEARSANFIQIRDTIGKSPSTTSTTLKMLVESKVIKKIPGFPHKYALEDYEKTIKILNTIEASHVDILKDRFADTFSYF